MRILDRYLWSEMIWPLLGGLLTFVVLITGHMLFMAIEVLVDHRVPLSQAVKYVWWQIPGSTIMALPVATMLAASLALNRLARDHELIALRAAGLSVGRLLVAPLMVGLVAAGGSLWLSGSVAPAARAAADGLLRDVVLTQKTLIFQPGKFEDTGRGVRLYVEGVDNERDTVHGLYAFCLRPDSSPLLVQAATATFAGASLLVRQPRVYELAPSGALTWGDSEQIEIDLSNLKGSGQAATDQMQALPWRELWQQAFPARQATAAVTRPYVLELHSRLAMALSCLAFALVAGPVTLRFGRGQSLVGVLATIITIFVFYVFMLWLRMLGSSGTLPPILAAWGANITLVALALLALHRQR
jgi:lipopolysaccharide export system permease protein